MTIYLDNSNFDNNFAFNYNILAMDERKLNRIKVVLAEKERTGKWLSEQLGVCTITVSRWSSNSSQPDLYTLSQIAKLLEVDPRELLNGNN